MVIGFVEDNVLIRSKIVSGKKVLKYKFIVVRFNILKEILF